MQWLKHLRQIMFQKNFKVLFAISLYFGRTSIQIAYCMILFLPPFQSFKAGRRDYTGGTCF